MLCPTCGRSNLVVKGKYYFCPSCNIYVAEVGSVPKFDPGFNRQPIDNSNFNLEKPQLLNNNVSDMTRISGQTPVEDSSDEDLKSFEKYRFFSGIFKQIKYIVLGSIVIGNIFYFFHYILYLDLAHGCVIMVQPSTVYVVNTDMQRALQTLKLVSVEDYKNVCKRIDSISTNPSCGGEEGGCFSDLKSKKIDVATSERNFALMVDTIIHEVCHVRQRDENRNFSETECYQEGDRVNRMLIEY